jgi:MscS family membrane protein
LTAGGVLLVTEVLAAPVGRVATPQWLGERMPRALMGMGPRELRWWQWLASLALVLSSLALGVVLGRLARAALLRVTRRTRTGWDDTLAARIGPPLALLWALLVAWLALPLLALPAAARGFAGSLLRGLLVADVFWFVLRTIDIFGQVIARSPWAAERPASRTLVPLGSRVGKVFVLAMAVVALLAELGYPVASLVAGLGIGGLALALAAQKTVENLFGAFSLGVDQPFREGDFVKVEDFVATVEAVGLRSTRFRTLDRTLVSIPNGRLADMRLENYSARDRMRLACTLSVVYGTTATQMRQVLEGVERVLRAHPRLWPDAVVVRFQKLGTSSLDIEVMAWFQTPEWSEFQLIRQEVLLQFMEVVEKAGTSFAFPTQTVHLAKG